METNMKRKAFTLIEILVTISIIALITGIVVAATRVGGVAAARTETLTTLRNMEAIVDELQTQDVFPGGIVAAGTNADARADTDIEAVVAAADLFDVTRNLLETIFTGAGKDDADGDGLFVPVDAWDREIRAVFQTATGVNGNTTYVRFESAGEDGVFDTDDDLSSGEIGS
jgi:prepilin-type N-terminal cleavage/methylation domain-containing protein